MGGFAHRMRHPFAAPSWFPNARNRRLRRVLAAWWGMIDTAIECGRADSARDQVLLGKLLHRLDGSQPDRLTRRELREELATWILTGIDTVANTLSWTLYLLAGDERWRRTLSDELRRIPRPEVMMPAKLERSSGLGGVLREAMRLYPQAYIIGRKAVGPFELDGHRFGSGTTVILNQWSMGRDPRWFDDPDRFDPARWRDDLASRLPRGVFFPFGAGPRICAGRGAAMRELPLILALLLSAFDIQRVDDRPVLPSPSLTLPPAGVIPCRFRRREGTG
jgi:cytochrome P450